MLTKTELEACRAQSELFKIDFDLLVERKLKRIKMLKKTKGAI